MTIANISLDRKKQKKKKQEQMDNVGRVMETLRKNQNEMVKIKQDYNRKENVFMCSSTDLTQPKNNK